MRIGVNTLFLVPGDVGGTETYLRKNLQAMVVGNPQETFVLFVSRDNETVLRKDLLGARNVEYVRLPLRSTHRPLRIIFEQVVLPWYVGRHKVDVLWSPGYTAPVISPCPQVVTIHDLQYKTHPDDLPLLDRIILDFLVRTACRRCQAVIAVSQFSKNEIVRFGFAPPEKVHAILEGVDAQFAKPCIENALRPFPVPVGIPYILCVAHTYPHKRVHLLVEAFGLIAEEVDHHLVLVGKARLGEELLQKSLNKLKYRDRVHRLSGLDVSQLSSLYQMADFFVLPSEYEGFGLPVLEAMLAGVPVVLDKKASLPEVGGMYAIYVSDGSPQSFAHAMRGIVHMDSGKKNTITANAKAWATSFTWNRSASETLKILQKISTNH